MNFSIKGVLIITLMFLSFVASNYVSAAEPGTQDTPTQKMLNHIISVSNCNEYEASLIVGIMANHSVNQEGLGFYLNYISGNDTAKEQYDSGVRYHGYYDFWNNYLKEWSKKNVSEKAISLNIVSPSQEQAMKIMSEADSYEVSYILSQTETAMANLNESVKEVSGISSTDALDVDHVNRVKGNFNSALNELYACIANSDIEFKMLNKSGGSPISDSVYDYKAQSQAIYNSSLSKDGKISALNHLKETYNSDYEALSKQYSNIESSRHSINTVGTHLKDAAAVCDVVGAIILFWGIMACISIDGLEVGIPLVVLGSVVLATGITMHALSGVMFSTDTAMYNAGENIKTNKDKFHTAMEEANKYIDDLIKTLN